MINTTRSDEINKQAAAYITICEVLEDLGLGIFSRAPSTQQIAETCDLLRSLIVVPLTETDPKNTNSYV